MIVVCNLGTHTPTGRLDLLPGRCGAEIGCDVQRPRADLDTRLRPTPRPGLFSFCLPRWRRGDGTVSLASLTNQGPGAIFEDRAR